MKINLENQYGEQLREQYFEETIDQLTAIHYAELPHHQTAQYLPYVRAGLSGAESRPLVYIPGFGEGIINKVTFAAELAERGAEVILPGQNRKGVLVNEDGKRDATLSQAANYLALVDAVAPNGEVVDVVTHSYGAQIFDKMCEVAPGRFEESRAVMLSPSGTNSQETRLSIFKNWIAMLRSEADQTRPMEFPDSKNVTGMASARTLAKNIPRSVLEAIDLADPARCVRYDAVSRAVARLGVLTYAEDKMFPDKAVTPTLAAAVESGAINWGVPVALERTHTGEMAYPGAGAVHDDEQYNPSRVAPAVLELLGRPTARLVTPPAR